MHRESSLIALGALIFVSPFLGLPYSWLMFILPVLGLVVVAIAISLRMRRRARAPQMPADTHDTHPSV